MANVVLLVPAVDTTANAQHLLRRCAERHTRHLLTKATCSDNMSLFTGPSDGTERERHGKQNEKHLHTIAASRFLSATNMHTMCDVCLHVLTTLLCLATETCKMQRECGGTAVVVKQSGDGQEQRSLATGVRQRVAVLVLHRVRHSASPAFTARYIRSSTENRLCQTPVSGPDKIVRISCRTDGHETSTWTVQVPVAMRGCAVVSRVDQPPARHSPVHPGQNR